MRWITKDFIVLIRAIVNGGGEKVVSFDVESRREWMRALGELTPEEAREMARVLLAAAEAAER